MFASTIALTESPNKKYEFQHINLNNYSILEKML